MNLLKRLTIKNLRMNRKRTIVTIIGIMLATSLITAVSGMASSFQVSMVEYTKANNGNYHYAFWDVPESDLKYFENNRNLEDYYLVERVGYAKLAGSKNKDKPYLCIEAFDEKAMEQLGLKLKEGRLPEQENEVVLSSHIQTNGRVAYHVGDTITLDIGERKTADGTTLTQQTYYGEVAPEQIEMQFQKTYTVVGIVARPVYAVEPYSAPGYTVITQLGEKQPEIAGEREYDIFTRYTKEALKNKDEVTNELVERENQAEAYQYDDNNSLIRYETGVFGETAMRILYSMSGVAIFIIVITSIFCIRNSFAISITEKMKQYGMLSSVGATSKQIRQNVYYEALILAVIGIPLGIFAGILALWVLVKLTGKLMVEALGMPLQFSLSGIAIFLAAVISIITIFLSAGSSARRASKVAPITAIRGNDDIKLNFRDVKSPSWVKRLFGIGGTIAYKSLRRNRKKYRTTVISIALSVSIFIAMSTFINLSFEIAHFYYGDSSYNLSFVLENGEDDYEKAVDICQRDGVKAATIQRSTNMMLDSTELKYDKAYLDLFPYVKEQEYNGLDIFSVGEEEYQNYLKKLGLSYKDAKDKGILIGHTQGNYVDEEGKKKFVSLNMFDMKPGDCIHGVLADNLGGDSDSYSVDITNGPKETIELIAITNTRPMGLENDYGGGFLIVSDEWMNNHVDSVLLYSRVYIDCEDADALQKEVESDDNWTGNYIENKDADFRQMQSLYTIVAIFLYGFITVISLIGITNIFNTITTSMELRSTEFAMLRSIGMTKREFHKMIRLESVLYGTKALLFGIPIGIGLSYAFQRALAEGLEREKNFPWSGVLVSVLAVFILLLGIMRYSLNKINRQNIIETIRKDNI